eukprot:scaffold23465_cov63-Phaeocystis_antarctica.AAC.3
MVRVLRPEVRGVLGEVGVDCAVAVILCLHPIACALLAWADSVLAHALAPQVRRRLSDGLAAVWVVGHASRALGRPPSRRVLGLGCRREAVRVRLTDVGPPHARLSLLPVGNLLVVLRRPLRHRVLAALTHLFGTHHLGVLRARVTHAVELAPGVGRGGVQADAVHVAASEVTCVAHVRGRRLGRAVCEVRRHFGRRGIAHAHLGWARGLARALAPCVRRAGGDAQAAARILRHEGDRAGAVGPLGQRRRLDEGERGGGDGDHGAVVSLACARRGRARVSARGDAPLVIGRLDDAVARVRIRRPEGHVCRRVGHSHRRRVCRQVPGGCERGIPCCRGGGEGVHRGVRRRDARRDGRRGNLRGASRGVGRVGHTRRHGRRRDDGLVALAVGQAEVLLATDGRRASRVRSRRGRKDGRIPALALALLRQARRGARADAPIIRDLGHDALARAGVGRLEGILRRGGVLRGVF